MTVFLSFETLSVDSLTFHECQKERWLYNTTDNMFLKTFFQAYVTTLKSTARINTDVKQVEMHSSCRLQQSLSFV